ncbi:MAG TPA: hypothetical protein VNL38_00600 [Candidatus Nitrosotenuis sp.]|nr:hypothetical protein [Candidatus Nitrosotenuis sp.]
MGAALPLFDERLTAAQLRRLHALWRAWTADWKLSPEEMRKMRHECVRRLTNGRAAETKALTRTDAALVIAWLEQQVARAETAQAAGTAGRAGFDEQSDVAPDAAAWRALWGCARALGMDRAQLELFIRQHYSRRGLHGLADIRTMADLNRVLWGLKAMLRRKGPQRAAVARRDRAA